MRAVKIRFLGGTGEVGRSAILVEAGGAKLLLDYGVMLDDEPGFPMHVPPRELDAIIITHAHLDHSGAAPVFYIGRGVPIYATALTFELTELLLRDFINLSGYYIPFEYLELQNMLSRAFYVPYGKAFKVKGATIKLLRAGHIPGSAQVLVEADGKRLLYTGDINPVDTRLLKGADLDYGELDAIIIESTYANQDHPNRLELEREFVARVEEVVEAGGTVLVPAFAVARAQEIACILTAHGFPYDMVMDGMARRVNLILMNHLYELKDPDLFMAAMDELILVVKRKDRKKFVKRPCVIISPAGMLKGGPAAYYAMKLAGSARNAIFLVSYQIPGTPGHELLENRIYIVNGKVQEVKAQVERFDFSSHAGMSDLHSILKGLEGSPKVFVVHGAEGNCDRLASWAREELGLDAVAPEAGSTFEV
ncbi:MBL fold metallo-hydrolase [Candidatus Bathyarchaeota archaeon]|nr:MAG: MBL fold metallo-hydrolase [Candidatus Bathyarchaeota archaeon]